MFTRTSSIFYSLRGVGRFSSIRLQSNHDRKPLECWNCHTPSDCSAYFCSLCGTLQPIVRTDGSYNYYSVFGLKQSFDLDTQKLSTLFKKMQRVIHPDRFTQRSEEEKKISEQCSTIVNEAYSSLLDPVKRALHLLQLNNVIIDENISPTSDNEFLMVILELNEDLENVDNVDALNRLEDHISSEFQELTRSLSKYFEESNFESAKATLIKARYFVNMKQKIKDKRMEFI